MLTVIIVNFNSGNCLQECVKSLQATSVTMEIIIVDNASTDQSLVELDKIVATSPLFSIIKNPKNIGFAAANNMGIMRAKGQHVLLLNPDCIINDHALMTMQNSLDASPEIGMVGCLVRNEDGSIQASCLRDIPNPWQAMVRVIHLDKLFPGSQKFQNYNLANQQLPTEPTTVEGISGACMLVKRNAINDVGLLDDGYFLYCEDDDWFIRFRQNGWKILFVPSVEVMHYQGVCGRSRPIRVLWHKHKSMLRFYRKFYLHKYPRALYPIIWLAVWSRFGLLSILPSK